MKRLLLLTFLVSAFTLASYKETYALPIIDQFQQAVGIVDNLSKFSQHGVLWLINSLIYNLVGVDPSKQSADIPEMNAIAFTGGLVASVVTNPPPIRTKDYFTEKLLADNLLAPRLSFAKTGTDFLRNANNCFTIPGGSSRCNFFDTWKDVRNIAYTLFIIVIVAVGLMVMLRYQTDPRTTVEAVTFIPKIARSLILITFSWVISGLIIDLSIVLIGLLGINIFGPVDAVQVFIAGFVQTMRLLPFIIIPLVGVVPIIIFLIFMIFALISMIMLLFELFKRYVTLIILAIIAPLAFLWGTLPGQEDTTGTWFKHMLVSALTFPAVLALLGLAQRFMTTTNLDVPPDYPLIGFTSWLPFAGPLMATVTIVMATKVPAIIEDIIDVKTPAGMARAGLQPGKVLSGLPFIGKAFK